MMFLMLLPFTPYGHNDGAMVLDGYCHRQTYDESRHFDNGPSEFLYQGNPCGEYWEVFRCSTGHTG